MYRSADCPRHACVALVTLGLLTAGGAAAAPTFIDRLARAHALIETQGYREARRVLRQEAAPLAQRPAQQALLLAAQGTVEAALQDDSRAIDLVRRALERRRHLPQATSQRLRLLLGQLLLRGGEYAAASDVLEAWFAQADAATAEAHWLLASAYLMRGRLAPGLAQLAQGKAAGGEPPVALERLLVSAQLRAGQRSAAATALQRVLQRDPESPDDWRRLAALQRELGADQQALGILEAARRRGWLTDGSGVLDLARLQLQLGVPYRAAVLLEDALSDGTVAGSAADWRLLIHAWRQAREPERARAAATRAARATGEPDFTLLQGQLSLELGHWQGAADAAERLLDRIGTVPGGTPSAYRAPAELVRGIALARQGRWARARAALAVAAADRRQAAEAGPWLAFVDRVRRAHRADEG